MRRSSNTLPHIPLPPPASSSPLTSTAASYDNSGMSTGTRLPMSGNAGKKPSSRRRKAQMACTECRRRQVKCDHKTPQSICARCSQKGLQCVYEPVSGFSRTPSSILAQSVHDGVLQLRPDRTGPDTPASPRGDQTYYQNYPDQFICPEQIRQGQVVPGTIPPHYETAPYGSYTDALQNQGGDASLVQPYGYLQSVQGLPNVQGMQTMQYHHWLSHLPPVGYQVDGIAEDQWLTNASGNAFGNQDIHGGAAAEYAVEEIIDGRYVYNVYSNVPAGRGVE